MKQLQVVQFGLLAAAAAAQPQLEAMLDQLVQPQDKRQLEAKEVLV